MPPNSGDPEIVHKESKDLENLRFSVILGYGGERGIRTPDTVSRIPVFKTGAFNHSAISPATTVLLQSGSFSKERRAIITCLVSIGYKGSLHRAPSSRWTVLAATPCSKAITVMVEACE
jgi:hypothetical protein